MITRREAHGRRLWKGFQEIARDLNKHGVPHPSDRWMHEVERFYLHPTALIWVACVGRGAGKNLVGLLCDLTELVFGRYKVPAGERHYHVHVSENRTEAEKTLRQGAQYLRLLGIPHTATVDTIDLEGDLSDRGEKVLANRIGANSGFRSIGGTTQEMSKWSTEGVNPAEEIVVSWNAQMVTHARARKRHFSTPMTRDDYFWSLIEDGETDDQIVTKGASWEFNPTISEEFTRRLAPNPRVHDREYRGIPSAARSAAFDADAIERAFAHPMPEGEFCERRLILDPSSGKKDAFTMAAVGWVVPRRGEENQFRPYLRVWALDSIGESFWDRTSGDDVADKIARFAHAWECSHADSDQREALMLSSAIERRGLSFTVRDWTAQSKPFAVERVRRWFAEGLIALPAHDRLRRELLSFEEKIAPSGQFTFGARGGKHDDFVALLITAALAEMAGDLIPHVRDDRRPWHRPASHDAFRDLSAYGGNFGRGANDVGPVRSGIPITSWQGRPVGGGSRGGGGGFSGGGFSGGGFGDYG